MSFLKYNLKYHKNTAQLFERISQKPWAMFLDSGQPESHYGRYDILVAEPFLTIKCMDDGTEIRTEIFQNDKLTICYDDPFETLKRLMAPYKSLQNFPPFSGGAVGYFAYDLTRHFLCLPNIAQKNKVIPQLMIGLYDWAVVVDHIELTTTIVSNGFMQSTRESWNELCLFFDAISDCSSETFVLTTDIISNMDFQQYSMAFNVIKNYITEGDCYQVNLAQRFSAKAEGSSWVAYKRLREVSPAPFMAYMNFGSLQMLSGSPERFVKVDGQRVEASPIKGTRPRAKNASEDKAYAQELQSSIKDKAENLMIVDLLRNDISKNCKIGSVRADQLFLLQSFANVHHLVSIVTGNLQHGKTAIDLLAGCFPGGSITGAPKLRAMQIIEELEPHRRNIYCGAIGYIGFDGNMDTNIAIRTAVYSEGEMCFYAGGGIVADSTVEKEYAETLDKASSMFKTMEYFRRSL